MALGNNCPAWAIKTDERVETLGNKDTWPAAS